ncbi:hypothetical protein GCM10025734_42700 [Kitasatospora paranensis]|uniref:Ig-like domain-containing protein n=1 Tax=Kitasatospora paranensis TaxID=258053 RepID=UPI0031F0B11E
MTRQSAGVPDARSRLRAPAAAVVAALLLGWAAGPVQAQQSPAAWSPQRRAVLPSGLAVQLDFAPLPGIESAAAPGALGGSGANQPYADGMRPGDPAETFRIGGTRPAADGSWRELGSLRIGFSRPVRNPRLHVSGLMARTAGTSGTTVTAARLSLTGATPAAPVLVGRTAWTGWTVDGNTLAPPADPAADTAADGAGTLEFTGTVSTVTLRMEQRSTARNGSTAPAPALPAAFTVTLDESLGSAPAGYGNASHLLSDLALGRHAIDPSTRAGLPGTATARPLVSGPADPGPDGGGADGDAVGAVDVRPLVEAVPRAPGPWAAPSRPRSGPGRGEYQGADPTLSFPSEAAAGRAYGLDVPVSPGPGPAVLAGWVDFDRNGQFDPTERVQAEVPAGASSAHLEWTVPERGAVAGETWARLRIARDAAQLVSSGGFADSGEVLDQRIGLAAGSARPEITAPATGTATADVRPPVTGAGGVPGATVAVVEDGAEHCRDQAGQDGGWSCRPDRPLADGPHTLTPVETTAAGTVLSGEPVRLTVKTVPPTAPVLTLPEFTNDPALLMTGVGEPGSTVSVAEPPGSGRVAGELCSTGVGADGAWSCLPVENLADGTHRLTATAVDAAGNRTAGRAVPLTVDTAPPAPPVLVSPREGRASPSARGSPAERSPPPPWP